MRPPRLSDIWLKNPVFFITICVEGRVPVLDRNSVADILVDEWRNALDRHGWAVGRYVAMPDHVHFFCGSLEERRPLGKFVGLWKEWTTKRIRRECGIGDFSWQSGFFDHLLRSGESRSEKWQYVRDNPVRRGLVAEPDDWPYQGFVDFE